MVKECSRKHKLDNSLKELSEAFRDSHISYIQQRVIKAEELLKEE